MRPHERRRGIPTLIADDEAQQLVPPSPDLLDHLDRKFPDTVTGVYAGTCEEVALAVARVMGHREVIDYLFNLAEKDI